MPALLIRSISFLKRSAALPKSPQEENRPSTACEIEEFLRCLPPSTPAPSSAPHNHHTSRHSPNSSTSSTLPASVVILPPSPPPTDVPPLPPPSYNSLERGYYNNSACVGSLPRVPEHMPVPVHVQDTREARPQHQRSSSREKNRLLKLRVETDLDFGGRGREPVLVYPTAPAEELRRMTREEISQWNYI